VATNTNSGSFNNILNSGISTYSDFVAAFQLYLVTNSKSWNSLYQSSIGQTLIDFISGVGAYNQYSIERSIQEAYLSTANDQKSILDAVSMLGVAIQGYTPSSTLINVMYKDPLCLGEWNASTNTPTLSNSGSNPANGNYYIVSVGGTVDFGAGDIVFTAGETVEYNNNWYQANPSTFPLTIFNPFYPIYGTGSNVNSNNVFSINGGQFITTQINGGASAVNLVSGQSAQLTIQEANIVNLPNFAISSGLPLQTFYYGNNFQYYNAFCTVGTSPVTYWQPVDAIWKLSSASNNFQLSNTSTGTAQILFGNGTTGAIPLAQNPISFIFYTCSGGTYNTTGINYKTTCINLTSQFNTSNVIISALLPITGGSSTLPTATYVSSASGGYASLNRIVTGEDGQNLLCLYKDTETWKNDFVFQSISLLSLQDILSSLRSTYSLDSELCNYLLYFYNLNGNQYNNYTCFIKDSLPAWGLSDWSDTEISGLQEYFILRNQDSNINSLYYNLDQEIKTVQMKNVFNEVFPSFPNLLGMDLTVITNNNISLTSLQQQVESGILNYFTLNSDSIGKPIYISSLLNNLQSIFGVNSIVINSLTLTIPSSTNELGYIVISVNPSDYLSPITPIAGSYKNVISQFNPPPYQNFNFIGDWDCSINSLNGGSPKILNTYITSQPQNLKYQNGSTYSVMNANELGTTVSFDGGSTTYVVFNGDYVVSDSGSGTFIVYTNQESAYLGEWDASTSTPELSNSGSTVNIDAAATPAGSYYNVVNAPSTGTTVSFDGGSTEVTLFNGDNVYVVGIDDGATWQRQINFYQPYQYFYAYGGTYTSAGPEALVGEYVVPVASNSSYWNSGVCPGVIFCTADAPVLSQADPGNRFSSYFLTSKINVTATYAANGVGGT